MIHLPHAIIYFSFMLLPPLGTGGIMFSGSSSVFGSGEFVNTIFHKPLEEISQNYNFRALGDAKMK